MKKIILLILVSTTYLIFGQEQTKSISDKTKKELMSIAKDLFKPDISISYNLHTNDLTGSFKKMYSYKTINANKLNTLLKKDNLNTFELNNIASSYSNNKQYELANKYYVKALKNINFREFKKDSAFYYSFRGLLKTNLNDKTAFNDFDRSLEINPADSIATNFYPIVLIGNGKYKKLTKTMEKQLNTSKTNLHIPYFFLSSSIILESIGKNQQLIFNDEKLKKDYCHKNYNEITDFTLLDKYSKKNKENTYIVNCRLLFDLTAIFLKIGFFEKDNNKIIKTFTHFDKKRIKEIISDLKKLAKEKKLNKYSSNKSLGFAYYLLGQNDKAIIYLNKSINIFPKDKKSNGFNRNQSYDLLKSIYNENSDKINFRKVINSKMEDETTIENTIPDLTILAQHYLQVGEITKAENYCQKIRAIDQDNFNALCLLFHISFIQKSDDLADYYQAIAQSKIKNTYEDSLIAMQYVIYNVYMGKFKGLIEAMENIKKTNSFLTPICNKLVKIIELNK